MKTATEKILVPDEFIKVITSLVDDIKNTFPEFVIQINKWWKPRDDKYHSKTLKIIFDFCKKKYPPRFFDFLYQNEEIFNNNEIDTEFLPKIDFKIIWKNNISEKTKETIWKYLQIISFSVIKDVDSMNEFGEAANFFEAVSQEELKTKLEETFEGINNLFEKSEKNDEQNNDEQNNEQNNEKYEKFNQHLNTIFNGKIGSLAKEIAKEAIDEFPEINMSNDSNFDPKVFFKKLIQNPQKLTGIIKKLGDKLSEKYKSGELKESEVMAEAAEMINNLKHNMPEMSQMFSKMGMGNLGKINTGLMQTKLNQQAKLAKTKERLRAKVNKKE